MSETLPHTRQRRRLLHKRNVALFILGIFLALGAWIGYWVNWAYTVEPNPSVDYAAQLEQLSRDAQPPGENGWPLIEQAIAKLDELEAAFPAEERPVFHQGGFDLRVVYDRLDERELEKITWEGDNLADVNATAMEAVRWLETNDAFDLLAEAASKPNVVRPIPRTGEPMILNLMPDLAAARTLAKARAASMHMAADRGDWDTFVAGVRDLLFLGGVYTYQPLIIHHLVGSAIMALAIDRVTDTVLLHSPPTDAMRKIIDAFEEARIASMALAIEGERRSVLDVIQNMYSDDGNGDGVLLPGSRKGASLFGGIEDFPDDQEPARIMNLVGLYYARRAEITIITNNMFDTFIDSIDADLQTRKQQLDQIMSEVDNLHSRYLILQILVPAMDRVLRHPLRQTMQFDGLKLMLTIELFAREHGHYPESLDDLVPEFLIDIPTDALTRQPFGYRLIDRESDPHGRAYLLYSFGPDGEDNGGAYDEDCWGQPPPGSDIVINRPDG